MDLRVCARYTSPHVWIGMKIGLGMLCCGLTTVPRIGFNYICLPTPDLTDWLTLYSNQAQLIEAYGRLALDVFVANDWY